MKNPYIAEPIPRDLAAPKDLGKDAAAREAELLRAAIEEHNRHYYVDNAPIITDAEFDRIFRRLQSIEELYSDLRTPNSPTRRIGAPPAEELHRVEHYAPMLSLNSTEERREIGRFYSFLRRELNGTEPEVVAEPKMDGLSVELVYRNGELSRGSTRGDGREGEEITFNLRTVGSVPLTLRDPGDLPTLLVLRGELFMPKSGFDRFNLSREKVGKERFANPRNAAAGSVRQLDSRETAKVPLDIYFYEVLQTDGALPETHWEMLNRFSHWGLKTNTMNALLRNEQELQEYYNEVLEQRTELDYEIDGVVFKLNRREERNRLGSRDRSPRWAMAWKFPPRKERTVVKDIEVQVGRTGILTPVALLEPVTIGGVTVSRASLHNADEVARKDIRPGDTVVVQRAGDVIPEVLESLGRNRPDRPAPFSMPRQCPACNTPVVRDGAYHLCPAGLSCPPQLQGTLEHFASREAMDIDHLGRKNIEQLVGNGLVRRISDIYTVGVDDLLSLDGFAETSSRNLADAIEGSKSPPLDRFLYALGIRHVGTHVAALLAEEYRSIENLIAATEDSLLEVEEVGPEIAESVSSFFREQRNLEEIDRLRRLGVRPYRRDTERAAPWEGLTFVLTGSLDQLARKDAVEAVEARGGRVTSSVTGNTDYLVAGSEPGSKLEEAKKRGTAIIEEDQFLEMLGES